MSASHSTFGSAGRNCLSTRSSATLTPGTAIVVRPRFFATSPEIPAVRISRSTRLRPTRIPQREAQLRVDPGRAIDLPLRRVDRLDLFKQPRVLERPVRRRAALPIVEAGAVDLQRPAHHRDWVVGLLRGDEQEHLAYRPSVSLAKKAAAFFKDLALHPQRPVLATQRPQLLTLIRRQPLTLAGINVGLLDPVTQRHV